jgi:hypothetical protein
MEELKRYQDLITGPSQVLSAGGPSQGSNAPPAMADDVDFFLARQYVADQKQMVILAPAGVYAAESVQTRIYLNNVTPMVEPMRTYYARTPRLRSAPTAWSTIEPQARQRYPRAFPVTARRWQPRNKPNRRRVVKRRRKKQR